MGNCQATKYRINYSDDTTMINNFGAGQIVNLSPQPPFKYTYTWNVYAPSNKTILSIDIISEDEQTIYQTITDLDFEQNKLYTLTQDVYVV